MARVQAILRRTPPRAARPGILRFGTLEIDPEAFEVRLGGEPVHTTLTEFRLLVAMAQRPGRAFPRGELLKCMAGPEVVLVDRNVDVHVSSLRRKLGPEGHRIVTVRGVGYKWVG